MDPSHKVSMTVGGQDELELKLSVQQVELDSWILYIYSMAGC